MAHKGSFLRLPAPEFPPKLLRAFVRYLSAATLDSQRPRNRSRAHLKQVGWEEESITRAADKNPPPRPLTRPPEASSGENFGVKAGADFPLKAHSSLKRLDPTSGDKRWLRVRNIRYALTYPSPKAGAAMATTGSKQHPRDLLRAGHGLAGSTYAGGRGGEGPATGLAPPAKRRTRSRPYKVGEGPGRLPASNRRETPNAITSQAGTGSCAL